MPWTNPETFTAGTIPLGSIIPFALPWNASGADNDYTNLTTTAPYLTGYWEAS